MLHSLEINEYNKISQSDHTHQIINFLNIFHKHLKNYELFSDINNYKKLNNIKYINNFTQNNNLNLIETVSNQNNQNNLNIEDEFIISKSNKQINNYKNIKSIFEILPNLKSKIMKEIGFGFESLNDETILRVYKNNFIDEGTFLGFFGGNVTKYIKNNSIKNSFKIIKRPHGIQFNAENKISFPNKLFSLNKSNEFYNIEDINFYSIFHLVKHADLQNDPNIILLDIEIPLEYFPKYFFRYIPYNFEYEIKDSIELLGAFSIKKIKNKEKLYFDYWDSHILTLDEMNSKTEPKWLYNHEITNPFLVKKAYENEIPKLLDKYKNLLIPKKFLNKENIYNILDNDLKIIKKNEDLVENKGKYNKLWE